MRFRNTIHLLVENFKNVYKILLFKLIVGVVAGALLCVLILPEINHIGASAQWQALASDVTDFFFMLNPGHAGDFEVAAKAVLNESLPAFGAYLVTRAGEIIWISIGCLVVCLLARYAETVCMFALGDTLDDKMQTYGNMTFSSSFVKNFGRASRYALWYVPYSFLFDVAIFALCYAVLMAFGVIFGLFFSVIIIALLQAIKLTWACFWMPAMTADRQPLGKAMKTAREVLKGQFWKTFSVYIIFVYLIVALNVLAVLCTFGSALVLTIPASFVLLLTFQYVNYYTVLGRRYFITYETISVDVNKGNSERIFERLQKEEEKEKLTPAEEDGKNVDAASSDGENK